MSSSASQLVKRCARERGSGVWEEFLGVYGPRLQAGIRRAARVSGARLSREDRQDLMQEVCLRLLERQGARLARCRASGEREVGAYLRRVAERVVFDHVRAAGAVKRGGRVCRTALSAERLTDSGPTPEQRALHRERRRMFLSHCRRAVGSSSPRRDLRILTLAVLEGYSSREICRLLGKGLTPGAVDSLIHRLKRRLARHGLHLPRR